MDSGQVAWIVLMFFREMIENTKNLLVCSQSDLKIQIVLFSLNFIFIRYQFWCNLIIAILLADFVQAV